MTDVMKAEAWPGTKGTAARPSAREEALEALRTAGAHPILQFCPDTVVIFDHDLRYLSAGGVHLAESALSREILEGHTLFEIFPAEVVAINEPLYRGALAGDESALDVSFGGQIYLQRVGPVRDADGEIVGGMAIIHKVTAARRSEEELRHSEEWARQTFEHAPLGKALIGLDGRFEQVNRAFCRMTGYSCEQLSQMTVDEITHPDDLAANAMAYHAVVSGEATTYTFDKRYRTASGEVIWISSSLSLVRRDDDTPLHIISQVENITERKEHERILAEERRRLRAAEAIGHMGSWELDIATGAVSWSDGHLELYGLDPTTFDRTNDTVLRCVPPEDRPMIHAALASCSAGEGTLHVRHRVIREDDGELRWLETYGERVFEDGHLVRLAGAVVDVTEKVLADAQLKAAHALQQAVINASPDIIFVYDVSTRSTIWTNRALSDLLGYQGGDDDAPNYVFERLLHEDDRALFAATVAAANDAANGDVSEVNLRLIHADGTVRWFSRRTTPLQRDDFGHVNQLVGVLRDITDAMAIEERLEYAALHDDLTGLPNRRLLTDRLDHALKRSERQGQVAVLFCDLDGFKRVNDVHGHHAGDAVLIATAARMEAVIRRGDTVARMGGDEFVIICGVELGEDPFALGQTVAQRVERAVGEPIPLDGVELRVTVSAGICVADYGDDADTVLRNSDAAMYLAKSRGKDGHAVFDSMLQAKTLGRDKTERQIRRALDDDSIEVYYQPIVEPHTGRVRAVEALLRVPDGNGGHIDALQAVTVAEQTRLITAIDERVMRLACAQVSAWRQLPGHAALGLTVNRNAADVARPGFHRRITDIVAASGLDPHALTIEITETVLLEAAPDTIAELRQLRADGMGVAIDDFGTGYASLRYLATLPISCLKVDGSFTAGLPHDPVCTTILRATVGMAADLGMGCVIEGVGTIEQLSALPNSPGMLAQGYVFARPLAASAELPTRLSPTPGGHLRLVT